MPIPSLLFGLFVALMFGALFHAVVGGSGWRLLLHFAVSCLGFAFGQWLGGQVGWAVYKVGVLDVGMGGLGSVLFLLAGEWLTRFQPSEKTGV